MAETRDVKIRLNADAIKYLNAMGNAKRKTESVAGASKKVGDRWKKIGGTVKQVVPGIASMATGVGAATAAIGVASKAMADFKAQYEKVLALSKGAVTTEETLANIGFGDPTQRKKLLTRQRKITAQAGIDEQGLNQLIGGIGGSGAAVTGDQLMASTQLASKIAPSRGLSTAVGAAQIFAQLIAAGVDEGKAARFALIAASTGDKGMKAGKESISRLLSGKAYNGAVVGGSGTVQERFDRIASGQVEAKAFLASSMNITTMQAIQRSFASGGDPMTGLAMSDEQRANLRLNRETALAKQEQTGQGALQTQAGLVGVQRRMLERGRGNAGAAAPYLIGSADESVGAMSTVSAGLTAAYGPFVQNLSEGDAVGAVGDAYAGAFRFWNEIITIMSDVRDNTGPKVNSDGPNRQ